MVNPHQMPYWFASLLMSDASGYSLEQLLTWCSQDRLIDDYLQRDGVVVIFRNGVREEFSRSDAHTYLKGVFTGVHRLSDDRNDEDIVA